MIPAPDEKAADWWANTGHEFGTDDEITTFLHDVPPALAAEALAKGRDQSGAPMAEPWPLDSWPDVPTRYLLRRDDRFFPADWTRAMVHDRLGITADEIEGGHCPFLSRPQDLAARLDNYAKET